MITYTLSVEDPSRHFLNVELAYEVPDGKHLLQMPFWRPGRYEWGNFAAQVYKVSAINDSGKEIPCFKVSGEQWEIQAEKGEKIKVNYRIYCQTLTAGNTYIDERQWYVNPVNSLMYPLALEQTPIQVHLNTPDDYTIACALPKKGGKVLQAKNYQELADSPFIASKSLLHESYQLDGIDFHLWFQGPAEVDLNKIITDFKAFTREQIESFGLFPAPEYHFLFQITPYRMYHGVEHLASTVIALGPGNELMEGSMYENLLGVSSHELYHAWNIKAIRPIEMYPYDFTQANYSRLGFVAEGVTTYMGDLMLLRSGVFSWDQFLTTQHQNLKKHFDNFGRFELSVAESSFDTWLDGYQMGAPERKVSIYTEGALAMFCLDVSILFQSNGSKDLQSLMKSLYQDFGIQGKGYSEVDFREKVRLFAGVEGEEILDQLVYGVSDFSPYLNKAFNRLGLELVEEENPHPFEGGLGFKALLSTGVEVVDRVYPGGPADLAGLRPGDEILGEVSAVKDKAKKEEAFLLKWKDKFEEKSASIFPDFKSYPLKKIQKQTSPNAGQRDLFKAWSKREF